jgi:hypothetical protein
MTQLRSLSSLRPLMAAHWTSWDFFQMITETDGWFASNPPIGLSWRLAVNGFLRSASFGLDDTSCGHLQRILLWSIDAHRTTLSLWWKPEKTSFQSRNFALLSACWLTREWTGFFGKSFALVEITLRAVLVRHQNERLDFPGSASRWQPRLVPEIPHGGRSQVDDLTTDDAIHPVHSQWINSRHLPNDCH